jgi:hypothetical protein
MLEQQRDELIAQVNAIVRAIAALRGTDGSTRLTPEAERLQAPVRQAKPERPRRRFVMSEEHKRKLREGQRRAREARAAAAGASTSASSGVAAERAPRLVTKPESHTAGTPV